MLGRSDTSLPAGTHQPSRPYNSIGHSPDHMGIICHLPQTVNKKFPSVTSYKSRSQICVIGRIGSALMSHDSLGPRALFRAAGIDYIAPSWKGRVPEWTKGTGCKPVGDAYRWFESSRAHSFLSPGPAPERQSSATPAPSNSCANLTSSTPVNLESPSTDADCCAFAAVVPGRLTSPARVGGALGTKSGWHW